MNADQLRRAADAMVTDDERWHPVGDWLNREAETFEKYGCRITGTTYDVDTESRPGYWLISNIKAYEPKPHPHALAVARAYLGETQDPTC